MFEIYDGRLAFYQWDVGQKVVLDTTPSFDFQVHFRDSSSDVCLVTEPYELDGKIVADVPDILLQSGEPITVWCYVMDNDDRHTIKTDTFGVTKRQKPADYMYTPPEIVSSPSKITYKESLDRNNKAELCTLEPGIYILYGYFTPYADSGRTITLSTNTFALCDTNSKTGERYIQLFSPYESTISYLVVSSSSYERVDTSLSGLISTVDDHLSTTSLYPVQNKVVNSAIEALAARVSALEASINQ